MESKKNKRKGLVSIVLLLLSVALLVAGTFAWFTDTATVKGNKVNAGTLTVDVVATVQEVLDAFANDKYKKDYEDLSATPDDTTNPSGVTGKSQQDVVNGLFDALGLKVAKSETSGNKGKEVKSTGDGTTALKPADVLNDYCIITNKTVPVMNVRNVEPGATYPVKMHVMNSGELAISYAAGFSIDDKASRTGLQALEDQKSTLGTEKYNYLAGKLAAKQLAKDADGKDQTYTSSMAGQEGVDLGGHLEDVLEVYAMTETQYNDAVEETTAHKAAMDLIKTNTDPNKVNYIGTISQIIRCNDTAYKMALDANVAAALQTKTDANDEKAAKETAYTNLLNEPVDPTETPEQRTAREAALAAAATARDNARTASDEADAAYDKLYNEQTELKEVAKRLAKASTGYCVPESLDGGPDITVYNRDGSVRQVPNPSGTGNIDQKVPASCIGTTYFAIHMPGEAGDLYQNAMLTLNAGITANQVELDVDGIHVMVYDDATARTTP